LSIVNIMLIFIEVASYSGGLKNIAKERIKVEDIIINFMAKASYQKVHNIRVLVSVNGLLLMTGIAVFALAYGKTTV